MFPVFGQQEQLTSLSSELKNATAQLQTAQNALEVRMDFFSFFFLAFRALALHRSEWRKIVGYKGLAKLGNIVAETMFLVMFPGVAKLGNICFGRKICVWEAKMFLTTGKNNFCFPSSKICFCCTHPHIQ